MPSDGLYTGCDLITVKAKQHDSRAAEPRPDEAEVATRRRMGKVVRDDRDSATVEWVDEPPGYDRVKLSLEATPQPGNIKAASGYNPYETITPPNPATAAADKRPAKRDLRKLSEWIKQMRDLEERKKRGED